MKHIFFIATTILLFGCNSSAQDKQKAISFPVEKTKAEWKSQLSALQYHVMREQGTERAFSSELNYNKEPGTYVCSACGTPLFKSKNKFDSGSGWPSFDTFISGNVGFSTDYDLGYLRTEEHCATCGGHLGHVFDDGPRDTTGKRHCVNGVALKFIPD